MVDYSRRVTDDFGVTTVVKRDFARRMSVRLAVPFEGVDGVQRQLAGLRATPARWTADDRFAWLDVVGFYKDFELDLAVPPLSFCTLTIEGLAETEAGADDGSDPAPDGTPSTLRVLKPVELTTGMVASNVAEADHAEWSAGVTYAAGAKVIKAATHRIYESAQGGNLNHDPAGDSGHWIDAGPTNRWAMFDQALGTVTEQGTPIIVSLTVADVDAVALLDVVGTTVRVQAPGYDRTQPVGEGAITFLDLPATTGVVMVTIAGGPVEVGTLLIGKLASLGLTEAAPSAGITDFSRKDTDEFGEVTVVERAWAKRMAARALIRTEAVDLVANRIASVRALPCLWIGDDDLDSLTVYGFFKEFSIEVGENVSKLALSIEGLSQAAPRGVLAPNWTDIVDNDPITHPRPEDGATVGGTVGEDIRDPDGNVLPAEDVITSQGTALNTANVGSKTAADVVEDIDGLITTYGSTASAASSATAAAESAALAQTAKTQAQQAYADSDAAKTLAQTANTAAQTAKTNAETAATNAATSAGTASGHATTASTAAGTATTKAGEASSSATSALGYSNAAATSASVAATTVAKTLPSTFEEDGKYFTEQYQTTSMQNRLAGTFPADFTAGGRHSFVTVAGEGRVVQEVNTGAERLVVTKGFIRLIAGHAYRLTVRTRTTVSGNQNCSMLYYGVYDASGAVLGTPVMYTAIQVAGSGWLDTNYDQTYAQIIAAYPTAAYIMPLVKINAGTETRQLSVLRFYDQTSEKAASDAATAAAASASSAGVSETNAGTSASTATTAANTATTKAGEASTSASNAATSATNASGSASTATTQAGLAATAKTGAETAKTGAETAKTNAETAASAASTSAGAASASATSAGTSATTAATQANTATTKAGEASTSAGQAATSATNALGYSNSASSYSTLAATSAGSAQSVANALVPDRPGRLSDFWDGAGGGAYTPDATPANGFTLQNYPTSVTSTAEGQVLQSSTGNAYLLPRGWVPVVSGRSYTYDVRLALISGADNAQNHQKGFYCLSATGANLGAPGGSKYVTTNWTVGQGWVTYTITITGDELLAYNASTRYIRPVLYVSPGAGTWQVSVMRIRDTTEKDLAAASASAAVTSASNASTSATNAGTSATAASTSATNANTSAGQASTSATNASTSASNASTAATNAALSASYVGKTVVPGTFEADGQYFTFDYSVGFTSRALMAPGVNGVTFVDVAGEGRVLQRAAATAAWFTTMGGVKVIAGHTYRFTARTRITVDGAGGSGSIYIHYTVHNASGVVTNAGFAPAVNTITAASSWMTYTFDKTAAELLALDASAAYVSMRFYANSTNGGVNSNNTQQWSIFEVKDVTESANAASSASSASGSATSASASAASAQTYMGVAAQLGGAALNLNPAFADFPTTPGQPTNWTGADRVNYVGNRVANPSGGYGYQMTGPAGASSYASNASIPVGTILAGQYVVVEIDVRLDAGTFAGAGYLFYHPTSPQQLVQEAFSAMPDSGSGTTTAIGAGVVGKTYRVRKLIQIAATTTQAITLYVMPHYSPFGDMSVANQMTFFRALVRLASPAEIQALTVLPTAAANASYAAGAVVAAGGLLAYHKFTAAAGANEAKVEIVATSDGSVVQTVAKKVSLVATTGGAPTAALTLEGGKINLYGDVQATGRIRYGNGSGWPVGGATRQYSLTDGQYIAFGTGGFAFPTPPTVVADTSGNGLAALAAGEQYKIYAEVTTAGMTARVRKLTPGSLVGYACNTQQAFSTGPQFQRDKGSAGATIASDGYYDFSIDFDYSYAFLGTGPWNGWVYEDVYGYSASGGLFVYSGGWLQIGTWAVSDQVSIDSGSPPSNGSSTLIVTGYYAGAIANGSGNEFGISVDSPTGVTVTALTSVGFVAMGSSGESSATPSGQKVTFTVTPPPETA